MEPKYKSVFVFFASLVFAFALAGCEPGATEPDAGPETVAKRFYELVSSAKTEGGSTTASEAYKLVDTRMSNLNLNQFLEIIKRYPDKFSANVDKVEVKGTQALAEISYSIPSSFGGEYTVHEIVALNIDPATNTWKVDFTGDTYGLQKDEAIAASKSAAPANDAGKAAITTGAQ